MAKRFASVFFISLGIALCCVFVFVLVLFLAPGLSVFGVKYIASGTHIVHDTIILADKLDGYSGSIKLEVDDIPVQVVFSQGFSYQVEYYDNFNGLTISKIDDPSIDISKDADGTAVIKVTTFKKFIYENGNSTRYVKLLMPSSNIGGKNAGKFDLSIISKNSSVTFMDEVSDNYTPYFKNITIETSGNIVANTNVKADTYSLKTINAIKLLDNEKTALTAKNYNLISTGGKIYVDRDVEGDIFATTSNARIQIRSCYNLTANSGFGDVYSVNENSGIKINGAANISTTAGKVEIDSIFGTNEKSIINTKTGNVTINSLVNADIKTTRGFVNIGSANKVSVETSSGAITVEQSKNEVFAKSKRGKIKLGGENLTVNNPTVEATFGNVSIKSATGIVSATSIYSNIDLDCSSVSKVTINAGGDVNATNLTGVVNIETQANANVSFKNFTESSSVVGTNSGSTICVNLLQNDSSSFAYQLDGNDVTLFEYNVEDLENHHQIGRSTSLSSSLEMIGKPRLTVTNLGKVVVYYKMSI